MDANRKERQKLFSHTNFNGLFFVIGYYIETSERKDHHLKISPDGKLYTRFLDIFLISGCCGRN